MKNTNCVPVLLALLAFTSCVTPQRAYYISPADIRSVPYATLPMGADPEKKITAVHINLDYGYSNQSRDKLTGGAAMFMQSHQFGHFQAYYGAAFGMGDYNNAAVSIQGFYNPNGAPDTSTYHFPQVKKYYGFYGVNGGIDFVLPFPNGQGEWRVLGVDAGYRAEFGDYLRFRRSLPEDKLDLLEAYGHMFTLGGSTEIVGIRPGNVQVGLKTAAGGMFLPPGSFRGPDNYTTTYYVSNTLHVTRNSLTAFLQVTFNSYSGNFQVGMNVNLRCRTKKFPAF